MAKTVEEAVVRKSIRVQVPIEQAFSVFVEQMEMWWPPAHHIGEKPFASIFVEPRVGGRWYERDVEGRVRLGYSEGVGSAAAGDVLVASGTGLEVRARIWQRRATLRSDLRATGLRGLGRARAQRDRAAWRRL